MKFKRLALLIFTLSLSSHADTPRPIMASSVYNNLNSLTSPGILYIPTSTPLANTACYFDNNSTFASSATTAVELSYVHGVTSSIQGQINALQGGSRQSNTVTNTFTIPTLITDYILNANTASSSFTVTLPDAVASANRCVDAKNVGMNVLSLVAPGSQTIDGSSLARIAQMNDSYRVCAVGGNWFIY